jgi:hypothetical protein
VQVQKGNRTAAVPVQEVLPGEKVLGYEAGQVAWTTVVLNSRVHELQPFVHLTAQGAGRFYYVTVTESHVMPRTGETTADFEVVVARELSVGNKVPVFDGENTELAEVVAVKKIDLMHRNTLATLSGTVVADNFISTTVCDDFLMALQHASFSEMLAEWKLTHHSSVQFL